MTPYRTVFAALFVFALMLLGVFAREAHAASIPLSLPPAVASTSTGYALSGAANAPSISGGSFPAGMTGQVAGKSFTVPATGRIAANAASFAVSAVRLNPTVIAASIAATWLAPYAIEWANNQFNKTTESSNPLDGTGHCSRGGAGMTLAACHFNVAPNWQPYGYTFKDYLWKDNQIYIRYQRNSDGVIIEGAGTWLPDGSKPLCPAGTVQNGGACIGKTYSSPSESDWDAVRNAPLPDAAANALAKGDVRLPVTLSPTSTSTVKVPLSDPYTDPVTGKRYRDVGYVTPSPTNPGTADFQTAKEEVDATGAPVNDPATGEPKLPEKSDDECLKFPNRLGCMEMGEVPKEADITKLDKQINITADSGWGADNAACPADVQTSFLKQPVTWSFKPVCDGADMFRPVVLAMAWISAVMIALGISRRT